MVEVLTTTEQQLAIAEEAIRLYKKSGKREEDGLCHIIEKAIHAIIKDAYIPFYYLLPKYMPLFIQNNAYLYANADLNDRIFWWDIEPYNSKDRLLFLKWMEQTLKEALNNQQSLINT